MTEQFSTPGEQTPPSTGGSPWSLNQLNRLEEKIDQLDERIRNVETATAKLEGVIEANAERARADISKSAFRVVIWVAGTIVVIGSGLIGTLIFALVRLID